MNVRLHRRGFAAGRAFILVVAASVIFAAVYVWLDVNKLHALRAGSNTGSYLQAALNFLRAGTTFDYGDWRPETAQHDQWLMLLLVPFVAVWGEPETVVAVQVAAIALAAPLLYAAARCFGASDGAAAAVSIAYLLSPSVQGFAYGDFVPLVFVPALACVLSIFAYRKQLAGTLVCTQLLTGAKEDVALFLIWFGAAAAVWFDRRAGTAIAILASVNVAAYALAQHFTGASVVHPAYALRDPNVLKQLAFFAEILAPFAFAPLALGARILLAAPLAAELMLAQRWPFPLYQAGAYYTIPLVTLVALSAAYVAARVPRWAAFMPAAAAVMALGFNTTVLHFGRHPFARDPQYGVAAAWARSGEPVVFPCEDQGAWVVASPDVRAKLSGCSPESPLARTRPAWSDAPLNSSAPWTRGPRV